MVCYKVFRRLYSTFQSRYKVLFFGSDNVSLISLKKVNELRKTKIIESLALVTANKKPKLNEIEEYAVKENILRLKWPITNVKEEYDIGVVVSFGHLLPKELIEMFPLGMINVHTSLLPRWRGAAPVIHTILNGDTESGITLMKIEPKEFDVGEIISQRKLAVHPDVTLPELTDQLAYLGADELDRCLKNLPTSLSKSRPQPSVGITYARKITPEISVVRWGDMSAKEVYNLYRAVYGIYYLKTQFNRKELKLLNAFLIEGDTDDLDRKPGFVYYCKNRNAVKVLCCDKKFISFKTVRVVGKREISAIDFYNGYLKKCSIKQCYFKQIKV